MMRTKKISLAIFLFLSAAALGTDQNQPCKKQIEELEETVRALRREKSTLEKQVQSLKRELAKTKRERDANLAKLEEALADQKIDPKDREKKKKGKDQQAKIEKSIASGKLCVGMTIEQAKAAMNKSRFKGDPIMKSESASGKVLEWSFLSRSNNPFGPNTETAHYMSAEFDENGVLVQWWE